MEYSNASNEKAPSRLLAKLLVLLFSVCGTLNNAFAAKCLYVSSYHQGYEWNDGIEKGLVKVLDGKCILDKFYMDTKRNTSKEFAEKMALAAKRHIDSSKPDVVIAADDNASKYLVMPYFKDAKLPFVFCGINWTVEAYGYPYRNVTGMIEVAPIRPLLKEIHNIVKKASKGLYLSSEVFTEHKDYERYRRYYEEEGVSLKAVFVETLDEWKEQYQLAQSAGFDFLVLGNNAGINDWDVKEAARFALKHAKVFSVTNYDWMMPYTMFAMTKLPEEQGEWAARVSLSILDGVPLENIPIVINRRWNIFINPTLVDKAEIHIPRRIAHKALKVNIE